MDKDDRVCEMMNLREHELKIRIERNYEDDDSNDHPGRYNRLIPVLQLSFN